MLIERLSRARFFALVFLLASAPASLTAQAAQSPSKSSEASGRARALVAAMTADEKFRFLEGDVALDGDGVGVNACIGHIPALPRFNLPALCMGDGPAGVSNGLTGVTQFPAPIAGAASWDLGLMNRFGEALAEEHAGKGHNVVLAPTLNVLRTPLWGRAAETFGEDPYLIAQTGVAVIDGIQSRHVIATPKHFVANNQEWLRLGDAPDYTAINALIPERALREIYYPGFRAAVQDAKAGSVMCAYNRINGVYACENALGLDVLRREWGFDGYVVSDWYFAHRSTKASAIAGMDMSMPGGASPFGLADFYGPPLRRAVASGEIPMARIDAMVADVITPMLRLGLVDNPVVSRVREDVRSPAHAALARRIAEEGTVLLRNQDNILPLGPSVKSIAVIGDDAGEHVQTTERYGGFVLNGAIPIQTPLDAIRTRARAATLKAAAGDAAGVAVIYARGTLGVGALPAIPSSVLTPLEDKGHGLSATYYRTGDWTGPEATRRLEPNVDQGAAILPSLPTVWSAHWEGWLTPPVSGRYRFSLAGGGEIKLTINGHVVAYTPKQSFRLVTHGVAALEAGRPVAIRLDYSTAATLSPAELRLGWQVPGDGLIQAAVSAAKTSDVAVVFVSDHVSEGADRTDLSLPGDQDALIAAVAAANPRTIVVLNTVGPVLMPWRDQVGGIFAEWYAGELAGPAIAALLYGDVDPSAKLPMTFPADQVHGPADRPDRYPGTGVTARYDEGVLVGYRWYDANGLTPLYPFGFGLSYTQFAFKDLSFARSPSGDWQVSARVANVGSRSGGEVAQLYLSYPDQAGEPPRQLKGFTRIELLPGETERVSFTLKPRDLQIWDDQAHRWTAPRGRYIVSIGDSSRNLPLSQDVTVADAP